MKSETQTKHDRIIANKLTFLIALWVLDKVIMIMMLLWIR